MNILQFVYSFYSWWTFDYVQCLSVLWKFLCMSFSGHIHSFLLGIDLGLAFLGHRAGVYLTLIHIAKQFPKWLGQFTLPLTMSESSTSMSCQHLLLSVSLFNFSHFGGCVMVFNCGFNLHIPDEYWYWLPFHMFIGHLDILFPEVPEVHFLKVGFFIFLISFVGISKIFWKCILCQKCIINIFSQSTPCLFIFLIYLMTRILNFNKG